MRQTPATGITDKKRIVEILREFLLNPQAQRAPFIPEIACRPGVIWNDREVKGGLYIEGARPLSIITDDDGIKFDLTNGDSNYTSRIGSVMLDDILWIELY